MIAKPPSMSASPLEGFRASGAPLGDPVEERVHRSCKRDEVGASLILALIFLVVISLVVTATLGWAQNNLNNVANFKSAQSLQSAVNSATGVAVQNVRYNFTGSSLLKTPPVACSTVPVTINPGLSTEFTYYLTVWCSTYWTKTTAITEATRTVNFYTCLTGVSAITCATSPLLWVKATMDDYYKAEAATITPCTIYCGSGITINNWVVDPQSAAPTVTSVSPSSAGQGATNDNLTVTGTGFISGGPLATAFSGTGITVNSTTFVNATTLTVNVTISGSAATGPRSVTVTNGDGGVGTSGSIFTVN